MRRYFSKSALFKVIAPLTLAAIIFIIHSCKKEMKSPPPVSETVALAKAWYESAYPVSAGTGGKLVTQSAGQTHDLSQWIKPDWQHPAIYKRLGKNVFEMPIDPSAKFSSALKIGKNFYNKKYTRSYFLLLNDGQNYDAYIMTIIADSLYVGNDMSKLARNSYRKHDPDFSGMVLYFTPKGAYLEGYAYKNGHLVAPAQPGQQQNGSQKVTNGLKTDKMVEECTDYYIVYYTDGVYTSDEYLTTICEQVDDGQPDDQPAGGGAPPPPPPCHKDPPPAVESVSGEHLVVNFLPPPTDPGDGGLPPPSNDPCPPEVKKDTVTNAVDPCVQKAAVKAKASNAVLAAINAIILGDSTSTNEYGANQNLASLTGGTYKNTTVSNGTGDSWTPTFTWDATNGYTVGWTHDHPGDSAPSPDDVLVMVDKLNNPLLIAAGANAIKTYKSNVSVTIVTKKGNYVVTVKDWGALQGLLDDYNSSQPDPTTQLNAFDADYVKKAQAYLKANTGASEADAGLYALQMKFGGSINIFRAAKGSTDYVPVTVTTINNISKVINVTCP